MMLQMYDIMTNAYAKYGAHISKEESLVFNHMIESMRHQGVGLQSSAKTEYLELQSAESALSYELSDSSTLKHAAIPSIHGRPLPRNPAIYSYILRHSPEEQVRRMIWEAQTKCDPGTLSKLLRLHSIRSRISQIRGFRNFAQCAQRECILNEPEAVETFLRKSASSLRQRLCSELQELLDLKRSQGSADASLQPWDLDYLIGAERDKLGIQLRVSSVITYFERLLHDLFGISLVRDTSEPLWHPLVAKFLLVKYAGVGTDTAFEGSGRSDTNENIAAKNNHFGGKQVEVAHLYLDLFARDGKASVCAQFTVRCSKLLGHRNGEKKGTSHFPSAVSGLRMTHGYQYVTKECTDGSIRQLPATAVVCSFPTDPQHADISSALNGTYIDAHSAQTLFHELGHTVHALCSRTGLQHLSGNRGGVDFAEFSSHLFELYFLDGIRDICKIEGLDSESAKKAELSFSKYSAIETGRMTLLALLDLKFYTFKGELTVAGIDDLYKSVDIFDEEFGSSKVSRLLGLPALSNFDHLIPYGGTYFCYLYSRVLAIKVWRSFEGFSRSRATGDRLYAFFEKGSTDASIAPLNELAGRDLAAMEDELFLD
ncbi:peptidase family M3 containing protein, putative [Babesia bigemina]|uniref:Peptidase family M3 containing protein, putative n=1 Tax=Babesia bigemina TaxID=5866 RepID=A0A061D7K2_BABBI|nr:peptidase family M3 containing protein, putative [Babesia bigemina]CDR96523.1 peptidase family M3 containing protein, putative [Babesia bigemina]|eukprot:XP_012768709.1 peptidase family M3 containing protein, putative [Babesia bigemina]